jgi:hypothetical protein
MKKILAFLLVNLWVCCFIVSPSFGQQRRVIRAEKTTEVSTLADEKKDPCEESVASHFSNDPLVRMFQKDCAHFSVIITEGGGSGGQGETPSDLTNLLNDKDTKDEKLKKDPPGTISFDKKIGYTIYHTTDGKFSSYFYLNSLTGWAIKDTKAMELLSKEKMEGSVHQLINMEEQLMLSYMKMSEGAFFTKFDLASMAESSSVDNLPNFFSQAKKTGTRMYYNKFGFSIEEYEIIIDNSKVFVYLTDAPNVQKSGTKTMQMIGFSGLGYLYDGQGNTFLIVALMNYESLIILTSLEDSKYSFNTSGYKGMNTYLSEQLGGSDLFGSSNFGNETMLEAQNKKNWSDFMDSNNLLALGNGYDSPEMTIETFDLLIATFDEYILGAQTALQELRNKSGSEASKRRAEAQCNLTCYRGKKSELEELKATVVKIQKNPRLSEDQKSDMTDKIYEQFGKFQSKPCDCWQ